MFNSLAVSFPCEQVSSDIAQIFWDSRLKSSSIFRYNVTVDGIKFRSCEPQPFQKEWLSQKCQSTGLPYEIAIAVISSIVWDSGQ